MAEPNKTSLTGAINTFIFVDKKRRKFCRDERFCLFGAINQSATLSFTMPSCWFTPLSLPLPVWCSLIHGADSHAYSQGSISLVSHILEACCPTSSGSNNSIFDAIQSAQRDWKRKSHKRTVYSVYVRCNKRTQREQVEAAGSAAKSSNAVYLQVRVKLTQNQSIKTVVL